MSKSGVQVALRFVAFASFLLALSAGSAWATVIPVLSKTELVARAHFVAEVRVENARTLRAGPHRFIYTESQVRIDRIWHSRGSARALESGQRLPLRQIGGRLGEIEHSVVGTAPIRVGDRLIVFARFEQGRLYLVGMGQGAFLAHREGSDPVVRNMFGVRPHEHAPVGSQSGTLSQLRHTVSLLARQTRSRK